MKKLEPDNTREFYGWVAALFSISFFLKPLRPYLKLVQGKIDFKNSPAFFVTVNYINCICWYIYSDLISSRQIKCINLIGSIVNFILIFVYLFYEIRVYTIDAILNGLIIIIGTYALYRGFTVILEDDEAVGNICLGTHFIALLSPFALIVKVIRKKNYNLIPIHMEWISLSASISWITYGVYLLNYNIILPNLISFIFGIILIIIYVVYSQKYHGINEFESSETLDIETNENNKKRGDEITTITIDEDVEKENKKAKPVKIETSNADN